jgi:hypothetical protein
MINLHKNLGHCTKNLYTVVAVWLLTAIFGTYMIYVNPSLQESPMLINVERYKIFLFELSNARDYVVTSVSGHKSCPFCPDLCLKPTVS